jgi:hypothetical protein
VEAKKLAIQGTRSILLASGVPERRLEEIYKMVCPRIKVQKTKLVYKTILRGTIKQLTQGSQEVSPPRKQSEENNGFSEHNSGSVLLDSCVVHEHNQE